MSRRAVRRGVWSISGAAVGHARSGHADEPRQGRWVMESSPLGLRLGAEALGTFLFFFLGFNAIAVSVDIGGGAIGSLGIAFAFGLGLALAVGALGQISGGHF